MNRACPQHGTDILKNKVKFMEFNFDLIINAFPLLLLGAGVTIKITLLSVALGVLIGLFVGIARIASFCPVRFLAAV